MAQHTPLPWHNSRKSVYVSDINHTCIAQMIRGQEENEANAAFIVKAANSHEALASALKGMVDMYCDLVNSGDAGFWDPEKVDEVKQARAALSLISD